LLIDLRGRFFSLCALRVAIARHTKSVKEVDVTRETEYDEVNWDRVIAEALKK